MIYDTCVQLAYSLKECEHDMTRLDRSSKAGTGDAFACTRCLK